MLSAGELERLRGLRLVPHHAQPSQGTGERRSKVLGSGLEFVQHRPYRAGDDIRHLDQRLMARLGQPFIRQFAADQKLPVTIIFDTSGSMAWGEGHKLRKGGEVALALAAIGVAAGDQVRICRERDGRIDWSPRFSGAQQFDAMFGWFGQEGAMGALSLGAVIARAQADLPPHGLVIVLSDWLDGDAVGALRVLGLAGHEAIAIQIALPDEIDPTGLGEGSFTLVDVETGDEMTLALDAQAIRDYRVAFAAHGAEIASAAAIGKGRHVLVETGQTLAELVLALQRHGVVA